MSPDDTPSPVTTSVFTDDCPSSDGPLQTGPLPQRISLREINGRHDVVLLAGSGKVIGVTSNPFQRESASSSRISPTRAGRSGRSTATP